MALHQQQGGEHRPAWHPDGQADGQQRPARVPVKLLLGVGALSLAGLALWGLTRERITIPSHARKRS